MAQQQLGLSKVAAAAQAVVCSGGRASRDARFSRLLAGAERSRL